ncbi:protein phosphatase 1 regulatory subunit 3A [Perognathus longimembris pacificus]|uniref:protein phosphatase 1 regulatory subunit 3A n=1 Tax=Perognathus longimembris pacificus TaxID=214514 RepID=UPI00201983A3|nr:protein phosphatase 1 regulatory subunit 3A [Perognathus longimembris pacificus]
MEPAEAPSQISKDNFLEVPNLSVSVCEDEEVKITFKPGFSPQPSRRSSGSSADICLDTPTSGSRRVSFADNFGFNLVSVKEFDSWEVPNVSTDFDLKKDIFHNEEYILSPLFDLPSSKEELIRQLQIQKAILESTEYLPGSTSMKGIIRVLNISFEKLVYVRMSLDDWQTHYDILAEYVPNSCDGETDQFSFKITLVPPYQKDGIKVEFCIRYETSVGTFWSNNNGTNYILVCQKKKQEPEPVKPWEEVSSRQIKGCLKVKSSKESSETSEKYNFENSNVTDTYIPTIIYSPENKEDMEISNQNVKDINRTHDAHNEKELDLKRNQHLITKSADSRAEKNTFPTNPLNFPNKTEGLEKKQTHDETGTDLSGRHLSPRSSTESSFTAEFCKSGKYSSRNEWRYQPSEETSTEMGEMTTIVGDTSNSALVQLDINPEELLDDNANPAHGSGRRQRPHASSDQPMAGMKTCAEGAKKMEIKDWEYLRRDFHSDVPTYLEESAQKASSKEDYRKGNYEMEQNISLGVNAKQNKKHQSISYDQETKMGHTEIRMEGTKASTSNTSVLSSKDADVSTSMTAAGTPPSPMTNVHWDEAKLKTPDRHLSPDIGTSLERETRGTGSTKNGNGNVLKAAYLFQVEGKQSNPINPEGPKEHTLHIQNQNAMESEGKARGSKTNITEQMKEAGDCKGLKAPSTEELFTCQETEHYELSLLADHGITEESQVDTAYIIKATSESTPESMSAREKAIIAKRPQETARSDRPIEVKETAFDPHEGRRDDSHYTLCQRNTAGVIFDKHFEKESRLDICNVHVDEMGKEEATSMYNPGKTHDRELHGTGNISSVEESSQFITGDQKAMSKLDLYFGVSSIDKRIFPANRDLGHFQEVSRKKDLDTVIPSAFNSDMNKASQNTSHVPSHHTKLLVPPSEQEIAGEKTITTLTPQSIPTKAEYNYNPTSEIHSHPGSKSEDVFKGSEIMTSCNIKARSMGQIFQPGECGVGKSLVPMILTSESSDNMDETKNENEGFICSGQKQSTSGHSKPESSTSASPTIQANQAQSNEAPLSKYSTSKIPYFLLFLIFLVTIYHFDLMIGLAFYLISLYWLYRVGGRQKEPVKKK